MTLDEAFEKYPDETILKRKSHVNITFNANMEYLKSMKPWACEYARNTGFIIPQSMIDDAKADDWEVYEPESAQ